MTTNNVGTVRVKDKPRAARRSILLPNDIRRLTIFAVVLLVVVPTFAWLGGGFKYWGDARWKLGINVAPIFAAPLATQMHLTVILLLLVTGWVMLALPKGDRRHKTMGWLWVGVMLVMSMVSLAVPHSESWVAAYVGGASALVLMAFGIYFVKRGKLRHHGRTMAMLMIALVLMTMLSVLPGRLMHDVIFGG